MERKKESFDCDGVIAEGGWVLREDRTNKYYIKKNPLNAEVVPSLQYLSIFYDIYVISTRAHPEANLGLRAWLHFMLGLEMDTIAGVITHPWTYQKVTENPDGRMDKSLIVDALGCCIHFDDDPGHVASCGTAGVLVPSDMPDSIAAANVLPTAKDWDTIRRFLTTPGMTLYGSAGVSVVSPMEEVVKEYPKLPVLVN
jgi:hypothetical protein